MALSASLAERHNSVRVSTSTALCPAPSLVRNSANAAAMHAPAFLPPAALSIPRRPAARRGRAPAVCATPSPSPSPSAAQAALVAALRVELPALFGGAPAGPDLALYSPDVAFKDPLNRFRGANKYADNIAFLGASAVFRAADMRLHDAWPVAVGGRDAVRTRWTLAMTVALPWSPRVVFTGTSDYVIAPGGEVAEHVDRWDSLSDAGNEAFPSVEAIGDLVALVKPGAGARVEGAVPCDLLRRARGYVVRRYAAGALEGRVEAERVGGGGGGQGAALPGGGEEVVVVVGMRGKRLEEVRREAGADGAVEFREGCAWKVRFNGARGKAEVWMEADRFCARSGTPGE